MKRLFVKGTLSSGAAIMPSSEQAHYIRDVLRLSVGDTICLVDERGHEFAARTAAVSRKMVSLVVIEEMPPHPEASLAVHLFIGLLKGKKMERLVRDAAELGVSSVTPFVSSRTIVRDIGDMKLARMKKIAEEESRLARRNRALEVHSPLAFSEAVELRGGLSLILSEEETRGIKEIIGEVTDPPGTISLFTGPEGGFSGAEIAGAREAGLIVAGLGGLIFRAETAPLVAAAIVQYEWGWR